MAASDPLIALLGFDPDLDPSEIREVRVEVPAPAPLESLEGALKADPRAVLVQALNAVFAKAERDIASGRVRLHPTGPLGICREAASWALKETAHHFRDRLGPLWVIGKRDNPQL